MSHPGTERQRMDITEEILNQHHQQRRMFALLDELDPGDADRLGAVWRRLSAFLEAHAAAEERYFYPRLLELQAASPGGDDAEEETKDAIKDHNEIRDAIKEAERNEVASDAWWAAVRAAREANSDHMAEEERDDLAAFRRDADLETRHRIAVDFLVFEAMHPDGVTVENPDPDAYVREHE